MIDNDNSGTHLRTKFVFVDTQALRKERIDWTGRNLSKLAEFAARGQLSLLVTDVTIGEVKSQLAELLDEANKSIGRHCSIFEQLGASDALDRLRDRKAALSTLEKGFDDFRKRTNAVTVPLVPDVKELLTDYFGRRPPFSEKKKSEFPDAISIAAIRQWCKQKGTTAYVVSADPDLKACCSDDGPLFHVESITEIISRATVSNQLREALERALAKNMAFKFALDDAIKRCEVEWARSSGIVHARITDVLETNLISLEVFEQREQTYNCQAEIETYIELDIDIEIEYDIEREHTYFQRHMVSRNKTDYIYPEVTVQFDQSSGALEFQSISLFHTVQLDSDDLRS